MMEIKDKDNPFPIDDIIKRGEELYKQMEEFINTNKCTYCHFGQIQSCFQTNDCKYPNMHNKHIDEEELHNRGITCIDCD